MGGCIRQAYEDKGTCAASCTAGTGTCASVGTKRQCVCLDATVAAKRCMEGPYLPGKPGDRRDTRWRLHVCQRLHRRLPVRWREQHLAVRFASGRHPGLHHGHVHRRVWHHGHRPWHLPVASRSAQSGPADLCAAARLAEPIPASQTTMSVAMSSGTPHPRICPPPSSEPAIADHALPVDTRPLTIERLFVEHAGFVATVVLRARARSRG